MIEEFEESCKRFNRMYRLPVEEWPTLAAFGGKEGAKKRIQDYINILKEEIEEGNAIDWNQSEEDILVQIWDWLVDIPVFCVSEGVKFGLPMSEGAKTVMESNFSKQNPDGTTSYDERGKVMKGPNYWKPEPKLRQLLDKILKKEEKVVDGERFLRHSQESAS